MIETVREPHSGIVSGRHARYVLRTPVQFLEGIDLPKPLPERAKDEMDKWF
ncbi:MAG: winged helix domain-containing protein, partial [Methyloceanibacter sp.]